MAPYSLSRNAQAETFLRFGPLLGRSACWQRPGSVACIYLMIRLLREMGRKAIITKHRCAHPA